MKNPDSNLEAAAAALNIEARLAGLQSAFEQANIPLMSLKGPLLQARLFGTPAAYRSGDVDVLVPYEKGGAARRLIAEQGWAFSPANGLLWRLSRAAHYENDGCILDLHWGLHAAHLPAISLRALERALWERAEPGPLGLWQPCPESLLVFLILHAVGHRFERQEWSDSVDACRDLVSEWDRVIGVARDANVNGLVTEVLAGRKPALHFDGPKRRGLSAMTWLARGHFLPKSARGGIRRGVRGG